MYISMQTKTDLIEIKTDSANLPQLGGLHYWSSYGHCRKQRSNGKSTYLFAQQWKLDKYVIPTRDIMSLSPAGQLKIYPAEAMDKIGYSEERISHQLYSHQAYRQDANTLCEEAGIYLNLRYIAAGERKLSWDNSIMESM